MTIDEADTILSCERLDSNMGCGASDEDIDEALGVAIDIMRKYQQICKILDKSDNGEQCMYNTIQEIEEIRDGNDD